MKTNNNNNSNPCTVSILPIESPGSSITPTMHARNHDCQPIGEIGVIPYLAIPNASVPSRPYPQSPRWERMISDVGRDGLNHAVAADGLRSHADRFRAKAEVDRSRFCPRRPPEQAITWTHIRPNPCLRKSWKPAARYTVQPRTPRPEKPVITQSAQPILAIMGTPTVAVTLTLLLCVAAASGQSQTPATTTRKANATPASVECESRPESCSVACGRNLWRKYFRDDNG